RVEMHRVLDPERAEHEHVVPARDRFACRASRVLPLVVLMRHVGPLAAEREYIASRVVAEHTGITGLKIAWSERRRTIGFDQATGCGAGHLRHVNLALEFDDSRGLRGAEGARRAKSAPRP